MLALEVFPEPRSLRSTTELVSRVLLTAWTEPYRHTVIGVERYSLALCWVVGLYSTVWIVARIIVVVDCYNVVFGLTAGTVVPFTHRLGSDGRSIGLGLCLSETAVCTHT